ncbi:UNKNOWN [Stylonychia lemnae]|uniref:Uncharacterized protein n=1 Tax=Stylonychia lemnae TaxID=5949 RepID=A0A078A3Q7_STYLE|nr:UNKNOWN [Stylonychia lemnae]|eukprot:CDW76807.1 UNKNOWN [Stylonychia lemnae]
MSKVGKFIRNCDLFAQPVYMTYKKDSNYRTIVGGLSAITFGFFVIWYAITQIWLMVSGNYNISVSQIFSDIENDPISFDIDIKRFNIAILIGSFSINKEELLRYVRPQFFYEVKTINASGDINITTYPIDVVSCNQTIFPWTNKGELIQDFFCPNLNQIEIYGQESGLKSKELYISVSPCQKVALDNKTECATQQEYNARIADFYIDTAFLTEYFNPSKFKESEPFFTNYQQNRRYLVKDQYKLVQYRVQRKVVSINDHLISFFWVPSFDSNQYDYEYYDIDLFDTQIIDPNVSRFEKLGLLNLRFSQDQESQLTSIQGSTITGFISNVGGFFSLINMLLGYLLYQFQSFRYESSLMKRLFYEDKPELNNDDQQNETEEPAASLSFITTNNEGGAISQRTQAKEIHANSVWSEQEEEYKYAINISEPDASASLQRNKSNFNSAINRLLKVPKVGYKAFQQSYLMNKERIMAQIESTQQYQITICNWIQFYFVSLMCCCKKRKQRIQALKDRFERAKEKLYYDLDILENIKIIRSSRFQMQSLLRKYQRQMIRYFKIYNVDHKSIGKKRPHNLAKAFGKIDLRSNAIDKKIAYKITEDEEQIHHIQLTNPRYRHSTYAQLL